MPPPSLTNFEMQNQNKFNFNGIYSRNKLPTIRDKAHLINLDEFKSIRVHLIALHATNNNITYLDKFRGWTTSKRY